MIKKLLSTSLHDAPGRAHVIKDWPYGRRLRCEKHIWIETRPGFGQRVCYRTTNPKQNNKTFNAPKNSGYHMLAVFGEDENGMLVIDGLSHYSNPHEFARIGALPLDDNQRERFNNIIKISRRSYPQAWEEWDSKQLVTA